MDYYWLSVQDFDIYDLGFSEALLGKYWELYPSLPINFYASSDSIIYFIPMKDMIGKTEKGGGMDSRSTIAIIIPSDKKYDIKHYETSIRGSMTEKGRFVYSYSWGENDIVKSFEVEFILARQYSEHRDDMQIIDYER